MNSTGQERCWHKCELQLINYKGKYSFAMKNNCKFTCKYKKRGVLSASPSISERNRKRARAVAEPTVKKKNKKTLESILTKKKLLLIDRNYKDKKSWVLKGLDRQHVRGYCHPSKKQFVPPTHPLCFRAFGSKLGGGCLTTPSHLLRLPLSARELREPSEPW